MRDAPVVRRLRAGGAVIVAKTNMTEFAFSGVGINPHYGTPGNPADRARIPGGSTAGGAVAAADGMCEISIGSDTGGSTRIPAALCGLTGFKPSRQRISTAGAYPLSQTMDSIGPIARTVEDCAKADAVMAGDDFAPLEPAPLAGLRIGIAQGVPLEKLDDTVGKRFPRALDRLAKAGARLSDQALPLLEAMTQVNARGGVQPAEAFTVNRDLLDRRGDDIDPNVRARLERARGISAADYITMLNERAGLVRAMDESLADLDVLAMPTTPMVAPLQADLRQPGKFRPPERAAVAQYLDLEFLRLLRHFAAAAARRRPAGRLDAGRAQRPRPPPVPHRRGGREGVGGLTGSELPAASRSAAGSALAPAAASVWPRAASDSALARASTRWPSRVNRSAWRRPSAEEGRRCVRPRCSSRCSSRTSRARSMPSVAASSACDSPALAPITTSTENCAGLMSIVASRRMKSWKIHTCTRRAK